MHAKVIAAARLASVIGARGSLGSNRRP